MDINSNYKASLLKRGKLCWEAVMSRQTLNMHFQCNFIFCQLWESYSRGLFKYAKLCQWCIRSKDFYLWRAYYTLLLEFLFIIVLISHQNKFKSMLASLPSIQNTKYMLKISAVKQFNRIDRERERMLCVCVCVCERERERDRERQRDRDRENGSGW